MKTTEVEKCCLQQPKRLFAKLGTVENKKKLHSRTNLFTIMSPDCLFNFKTPILLFNIPVTFVLNQQADVFVSLNTDSGYLH